MTTDDDGPVFRMILRERNGRTERCDPFTGEWRALTETEERFVALIRRPDGVG